MTQPLVASGLWRRLAIENPDGSGDTSTQVFWLQAGSYYADIRIPADRPAVAEGEIELSNDLLRALARQQGFAGETVAAGELCLWQRWLDFQPPALVPDEGRLEFNGRMLVEYGVHAPYIEHWWYEEDASGHYAAFRLQGECSGMLLIAGGYFMRAIGRAQALPQGMALEYLIEQAAGNRQQLASLLDCEISFGRCDGAPRSWRITHSTLPWLEGDKLFAAGAPDWQGREQLVEPLAETGERLWLRCESTDSGISVFDREAYDA
ncbi:hypothetical protein [Mariprofundus ferrooxydans]|uniref:hypothetical protein n=1 Tax=Mariprofundus ferrooxydans TaxID=314344 RepID=UPI00035C7B22|nr:hypothetical protein [Mariprofundus ferrooxydans]